MQDISASATVRISQSVITCLRRDICLFYLELVIFYDFFLCVYAKICVV
jgi:hypothetical protein